MTGAHRKSLTLILLLATVSTVSLSALAIGERSSAENNRALLSEIEQLQSASPDRMLRIADGHRFNWFGRKEVYQGLDRHLATIGALSQWSGHADDANDRMTADRIRAEVQNITTELRRAERQADDRLSILEGALKILSMLALLSCAVTWWAGHPAAPRAVQNA